MAAAASDLKRGTEDSADPLLMSKLYSFLMLKTILLKT